MTTRAEGAPAAPSSEVPVFLNLATMYDALLHYATAMRTEGRYELASSAERIAQHLPELRALIHNAAQLYRIGAAFNHVALRGLDYFGT